MYSWCPPWHIHTHTHTHTHTHSNDHTHTHTHTHSWVRRLETMVYRTLWQILGRVLPLLRNQTLDSLQRGSSSIQSSCGWNSSAVILLFNLAHTSVFCVNWNCYRSCCPLALQLFVAEDSLSLCKDVLTEPRHLVLDLGANSACSPRPSLTPYPWSHPWGNKYQALPLFCTTSD